jgi:aspartate/methionine/tyrosine aminotransferase
VCVGLEYVPATHGLFVFTKLVLGKCTVEMENAAVDKLAKMGLIVKRGQRFTPGEGECGWIRITFAMRPEKIERALAVLARFRAHE